MQWRNCKVSKISMGMGEGWIHSWSGPHQAARVLRRPLSTSLAVVPPDGISALFLKEMGAVVLVGGGNRCELDPGLGGRRLAIPPR